MSINSWPEYITRIHEKWLGANDLVKSSLTGLFNSTTAEQIQLTYKKEIPQFQLQSKTVLEDNARFIDSGFLLSTLFQNPTFDEANSTKTLITDLDEKRLTKLSEVKAKFRKLNSVQNSAFVLACSQIDSDYLTEVSATLAYMQQVNLNVMLKNFEMSYRYNKLVTNISAEVVRVVHAARFTFQQFFLERDAYNASFNLALMRDMTKHLASISGSVLTPTDTKLTILQMVMDPYNPQSIDATNAGVKRMLDVGIVQANKGLWSGVADFFTGKWL